MRVKLELEERLADTDFLTGVNNSRSFYEHVESERVRAGRYGRPFTIAYIDIDNFKVINDTYGHDAGDQALQEVARAIQENVRQSDVIGRLGGDEFAGLFPEAGFEASRAILQNLMPILTGAMKHHNWLVTFSIGAVTFMKPMDTVRDMIKQVDGLMYRVKKLGKNNIMHIQWNDGQ